MDQKIIDLYDDFTHRHLDRRLFLEQVTKLVGSSALAMTIMAALRSDYARAATIAVDDARLTTQNVSMPGGGGSGAVKGYLARPKGDAKLPGVVVIHQNRGLNPHIEDVTRRVALEGYVAVGVDCMSVLGGTPKDEDQAMKDFSKLTADQATGELVQAVAFLKSRPDVSGKIGTIGFCWGGGMVNRLAEAAGSDLNAGVAFYGTAPPLDQVSKIKAALLLNYAGLDDRVNATKPGYEDALKAAQVDYTAYVYPNVNHAFFDDTTDRYNADAAKLAWDRAKAFFAQHLKA
jgi:carboxymethylenebutenolidase